ncbi:dsRBD fold-containing protein [Streptomyces sp. NPDC001233]
MATARCNPINENIPDIAAELAVAHAQSPLTHQLVHGAATDIEAHTHKPVERLKV